MGMVATITHFFVAITMSGVASMVVFHTELSLEILLFVETFLGGTHHSAFLVKYYSGQHISGEMGWVSERELLPNLRLSQVFLLT